MKYIFDLDDTLVESTILNNDAYNFALEQCDYLRVSTSCRLTRVELGTIPPIILKKIIRKKQKYFASKWLPYRITINTELVKKLTEYGRDSCYLWTKACKGRARAILKYCNLRKFFKRIIYDDKLNFSDSIQKLKVITQSNELIIYENDCHFSDNENIEIIESMSTDIFEVFGYYIR